MNKVSLRHQKYYTRIRYIFGKDVNCSYCHKKIYHKNSRIKLQKSFYCSKKCQSLNMRKLKYKQDMIRMKKEYLKFTNYLKSLNPIFLGWLAGFWEGEGHIEKHKNTNYNFVFTIAQKDPTSLYRIQQILQIGKVRKTRYKNIYMFRYDLYKSGQILAIIEYFKKVITGKYRTKQINKIYNLLKKIK